MKTNVIEQAKQVMAELNSQSLDAYDEKTQKVNVSNPKGGNLAIDKDAVLLDLVDNNRVDTDGHGPFEPEEEDNFF